MTPQVTLLMSSVGSWETGDQPEEKNWLWNSKNNQCLYDQPAVMDIRRPHQTLLLNKWPLVSISVIKFKVVCCLPARSLSLLLVTCAYWFVTLWIRALPGGQNKKHLMTFKLLQCLLLRLEDEHPLEFTSVSRLAHRLALRPTTLKDVTYSSASRVISW